MIDLLKLRQTLAAATTQPVKVTSAPPIGPVRTAIIAAGQSQVGVPYSFGGGGYYGPSVGVNQGSATIGYDCGKFVQYAFYQGTVNSTLKPTRFISDDGTQRQAKQGIHVGWTYGDIYALATPGDVIFFNQYGHAGIFVGFGTDPWGHTNLPVILHAPHTGSFVTLECVLPGEGGLMVSEIRQYVPKTA